ncbi:MAG: DUF4202 family protein [Nanoarchaeota archaeon]
MDLNKIEEEIKKIILKSYVKTDLAHAISTRKWVLKLKPDSSLALQLSAFSHDIERGVYGKIDETKIIDYEKFKAVHSKRSAEIVKEILEKNYCDKEFIRQVEYLILNHEFGGNDEANILADADSLSFFEENLEQYFEKYGLKVTEEKIKFMINRMSPKSRRFLKKIDIGDQTIKKIFENLININ